MAVISLEIIEISSGEVVETMDVSGYTPRSVEKILSGLLHQMNTAEYFVKEVEA